LSFPATALKSRPCIAQLPCRGQAIAGFICVGSGRSSWTRRTRPQSRRGCNRRGGSLARPV
jgi:hypothetical protein